MSGFTLVSENVALEERLNRAFGESVLTQRRWTTTWVDAAGAAAALCADDPILVIIGPDVDREDAIELSKALDIHRPDTGIIVATTDLSSDTVLALMRAGAREVCDPDSLSDGELRDVVDRISGAVIARAANLGARKDSVDQRHVIAILSPKGGSGKTTVATNLAVGLARTQPGNVLLIDLDVQFGDVATALALSPESSLFDAAGPASLAVAAGTPNATELKLLLTQHESSLAVLTPPTSLAEAEEIDTDALKRVLASLAREYQYIVVDTAAGFDELALVALELATDLVFVSSTDVPSVRAVQKQVAALDLLGVTGPSRTLVVNRCDAKVGIERETVERTVGMNADICIPSSRSIPLSTNEGVPLLMSSSADNVARSFRQLVGRFAPQQNDVGHQRRFFRRS